MSDEDRMNTSEEEDEEEDDEHEGPGLNMMNFMFGNVDSHGELESDFLDEVCQVFHWRLQKLSAANGKSWYCHVGGKTESWRPSEFSRWLGHLSTQSLLC